VINDYTVTVTALLDGEITAIEAREGDRVKAGKVLARLDSVLVEAGLKKAEAQLVFREQELITARRRFERMGSVSTRGDESRQALDDTELSFRSAEAGVKEAEANVQIAQRQVRNASVRAPFDGVVTEQTAETGQWVEAGTQLFTVVATAGRVIEAPVDASDAARVSLDQSVSLSRADASQSEESRAWASEVVWISQRVNVADGGNSFDVRLALDERAPSLMLGEQIDVELEIDSRTSVPVLPLEAIRERGQEEAVVYVFTADGTLSERQVRTGLFTVDAVEIVEGLIEGESVALPRGVPLSDGLSVTTLP